MRQLAICKAGLRRRRIVPQGELDDLPWMDTGFIQSIAKQLMKAEYPVLVIE